MDTVVVHAFSSKLARGCSQIYIVLDKNQVNKPHCKKQRRATLDLKDWGVHMRARNPKVGMMSCQHEKTWTFDHNLLVLGSWNCSENSFSNCEEACVVSKSPVFLAAEAEHFVKLWESASEIDWEDIEEKEEIALQDKPRDRSPPRRR